MYLIFKTIKTAQKELNNIGMNNTFAKGRFLVAAKTLKMITSTIVFVAVPFFILFLIFKYNNFVVRILLLFFHQI